MINAIRTLYTHARSRVLVNGRDSDNFQISSGVCQGDALSFTLFVLLMELLGCAIRDALPPAACLTLPSGKRTQAYYMDDTVVTLSSLRFYDALKTGLDSYCAATGAMFNVDKTRTSPRRRPFQHSG